MNVTRVGEYIVIVHGAERPSDDAWDDWLRMYREGLNSLRGVLIYSRGGGPDAEQRRRLLDVVERAPHVPPTAIVTPSRLMRMLVSALNWFLPPAAQGTIFAPAQLDRALDHLSVPPTDRNAILAQLARYDVTGADLKKRAL